ncbi:glycosyltransferase family 8 protein [Shewanella surugensis]|uniref:Glycosyltransferase family 8 protein n=1 Tax=Shewanella surugensis TaxID=212020 RepID=A0ABT0L827_9GAMM|nr:glycosyltransferase family 8 protein [Shewanella surugensis]MCL1123836.1 glycosyltransferase family 8 protein [Shewanella surugensis]
MFKNAYVTLVNSPDYVIGAVALKRSLVRVQAQAPLICIVVPHSCDCKVLVDEGCLVKEVDAPVFSESFCLRHSREFLHNREPFDKGDKPDFHNPLNNFCKLLLWTFDEYDKLIFLDADTLVLKNIDHLFCYPGFLAAPNVYNELDGFHRMNSGVFVAEPSQLIYKEMLDKLDVPGAFWRRTDQTFLQEFWPNWHGLPYIYNVLQHLFIHLPELWRWDEIYVIHYQYEKPWQKNTFKKQLKPLIDLWWAVYQLQDVDTMLERLIADDS